MIAERILGHLLEGDLPKNLKIVMADGGFTLEFT